jgi:hypothetical protein
MNEEQNFSTIPNSYKPHDYRKARYAHNTGDADLPIPFADDILKKKKKKKKKKTEKVKA